MGEEGKVVVPTVFDLQERPFQYDKLREACQRWGCFRVVNHGVPVSLMSEMNRVARSLFDLPIHVKSNYESDKPGCEYIPRGRMNPIIESLCISDLTSSEVVQEFCSAYDASPRHREVIETYSREICAMANDVAGKVAKSLGLSGGSDHFLGWPCRMRIHEYRFSPKTVGECGLPLHTDSSFLSFIQEDDDVGGLEILDNKSGSFIAVKPQPGTFFVNLGDFAVAWSNGKFSSVKHRVQHEGRVRVSIATFMIMPYGVSVESPEELIDSQNPRLYVPFSFDDYTMVRDKKKTRTDEALIEFCAQP